MKTTGVRLVLVGLFAAAVVFAQPKTYLRLPKGQHAKKGINPPAGFAEAPERAPLSQAPLLRPKRLRGTPILSRGRQ